jgi:thiamine biosynthesis protein ThiS
MSAIVFNDERIPVGKNITVRELLISNGLDPSKVMIRVNGRIVGREHYDTFAVPEGATVKAYPFVGGG